VFAVRVEVEFESAVDSGSSLDDVFVLSGEPLAEFFGEEVAGFFSDDLFFGFEAEAVDEGFVNGDVVAVFVFDEVDNVGDEVEKVFT